MACLDLSALSPRPETSWTRQTDSSETVASPKPLKDLVGIASSVAAQYPLLNGLFELYYPTTTKKSPKPNARTGESSSSIPEHLPLYKCASDAFDEAYTKYGLATHMGVLDPSYHIFVSQHGYGSAVYRIRHRTAVITGDPLCSADDLEPLMGEFFQFSCHRKLHVAFMGVSEVFADYAKKRGWTTILFARERVLNPQTNMVLRKQAGKRMMAQNRRLLDPHRLGLSVYTYSPSSSTFNPKLEVGLQTIYDEWRRGRNSQSSSGPQAFITVFNLFSYPDVTMFVYATDSSGTIVGFAELRSTGAVDGFHLDPCVATPDAPSGTTELLITMSMLLLREAGIGNLSLGFEPLSDLTEISGQPNLKTSVARWGYRQIISSLPIKGKTAFNDKFKPDKALEGSLYIAMPRVAWPLRQGAALMHIANIKLGRLLGVKVSELKGRLRKAERRRKEQQRANLERDI